MARLRQIIDYIQLHLGELNPTHKMLIGSVIIIMAMTTFLVVQYSGNARTVVIKLDESQRITALTTLRAADIPAAKNQSGQLTVPIAYEQDALALLTSNQTMSGASLFEMIKEQPWWANRQQNQNLMDAAKAQYLSQLISRWPAVRDAQVFISSPLARTGLGQQKQKSTASVQINPKGSELTIQQARAIADFIAGTTPGLESGDIRVTDIRNGRTIRIPSEDDQTANKYLAQQTKIEKHYESKIADAVAIPGAIVMVSAQIDVSPETINEKRILPEGDGSLIATVSQTKGSMQNTGGPTSGGSPGVSANTSSSIGASANRNRPPPMLTESDSTSASEIIPGETNLVRMNPKGYALKVNATINVPRSYFARIWQLQNSDATDPPTDDDLTVLIASRKSQIESMARLHIDTDILQRNASGGNAAVTNGDVIVGMYYDFEQELSLGGGMNMAEVGGSFVSMGDMQLPFSWRSIGMGGLTVLSLFMMFRLVKSGTVRRRMPSAEELVGIPPSLGGEDTELIGEADEAEPAMEALELDEEDIRAQKITEQVDEMVTSSPREAARLVSRWIDLEE